MYQLIYKTLDDMQVIYLRLNGVTKLIEFDMSINAVKRNLSFPTSPELKQIDEPLRLLCSTEASNRMEYWMVPQEGP